MRKIKLFATISYETPRRITKDAFKTFVEKNNAIKKDDDFQITNIIVNAEEKVKKMKDITTIRNLSKGSASQLLLGSGPKAEDDYLSNLNVEVYANEKYFMGLEKDDAKEVIDKFFVQNDNSEEMFKNMSFDVVSFTNEEINAIDTYMELNKQLVSSNIILALLGERVDFSIENNDVAENLSKKSVGTEKLSKEELLNKYSDILNKNVELLHEVERQFKVSSNDNIQMIGYYLENKRFEETHINVLTESLYATGRITQNAYYVLNVDMKSIFDHYTFMFYEQIIKLSSGCFLIIKFHGRVNNEGGMHFENYYSDANKACDKLLDKLKSMQYSTTYGFITNEEVKEENYLNVTKLERELKLIYFTGKFSEKQAIDYAISYLTDKRIKEIKEPIIEYIKDEYQKGKILSLGEIESYILEILRTRAHRKYSDAYSDFISKKVINKDKTNLDNVIGLENFKQEVTKLINMKKMLISNEDLTLSQVDDLISNIGFRFEGETGVGKSMAANILTKILYQDNIIKKDYVRTWTLVESDTVNPFYSFGENYNDNIDFMAPQNRDETNIGVLLVENIHGVTAQALNEFLNNYDENRKKAVVIICGTKKEFDELDNKVPGFKSRFSKTVEFSEYSVDELLLILKEKLINKNYTIDDDTIEVARKYFEKAKQIKNFGNARFVENFAEHIIEISISRMLNTEVNHNKNMFKITKKDLSKVDMVALLGNEYKKMEICDNAIYELNNLIGLDSVKKYIKSYIAKSKIDKLKRNHGLLVEEGLNMHLCFTGNPGTAKTTVARQFARILYANGIVDKPSVIECGLNELQGEYLGQTAPKIIEKFEEAKGGVLFIDEAYALNNDDIYSKQTIDTVVAQMENHREDVIVIFAGYKEPMENFIKSNPGLKGRVSRFLEFPNYSVDELMLIFDKMLQDKKHILKDADEVKKIVRERLEPMLTKQDFANAREVRLIIENAVIKQSMRLFDKSDEELDNKELLMTLTADDFRDNVSDFYKEKTKIGFAA